MPASVNVVYKTLKDLVNKDQQGFVNVDEFNKFAQVAQLRIFNRLFDQLKDGSKLERAGFGQGRDKSKYKQIQEDLAIFATSSDVTRHSTKNVFLRNSAEIDDLARIISISTAGSLLLGQTTRTPVEICYDEEKIERILSSTLNAPTESFPVALITGDIEVFPESIKKIKIRYYKLASGATNDEYDSTNSYDFELPEHYTMDLVVEIASLIGVNLRDQQVTAYAAAEQVKRTNEQN
jgi:hypothetical protein